MNKKIKIIMFISFFIIVSMVIIFGGVSLSTNKFVFSTRYYKTPRKAFEKENSTIEIRKDINIFWFDEYNSFYIAETENNELLICKMFCKKISFSIRVIMQFIIQMFLNPLLLMIIMKM